MKGKLLDAAEEQLKKYLATLFAVAMSLLISVLYLGFLVQFQSISPDAPDAANSSRILSFISFALWMIALIVLRYWPKPKASGDLLADQLNSIKSYYTSSIISFTVLEAAGILARFAGEYAGDSNITLSLMVLVLCGFAFNWPSRERFNKRFEQHSRSAT